ncbi:MAG: glycosidase [Syntrophomonadaceae bacterium]
MPQRESERLFDESIGTAIEQIRALQDIELVIGIPFYNETQTLLEMLEIINTQLADYLTDKKTIFICSGDPAGSETLEILLKTELHIPLVGFTMKPGINGRGSSIRAIMELSRRLEANLIILAADLPSMGQRGFQANWVKGLIESIQGPYDLTVGIFERHHSEDVIAALLVAPILEVFYNYHFKDPLSGIYAVSHDLLEELCLEIKFATDIIRGYGIEPWLLTRAIMWKKNICQLKLGSKLNPPSIEKLNYLFKDLAASIFACIENDHHYWSQHPAISISPDILGDGFADEPCPAIYTLDNVLRSFKRNALQYRDLYEKILPTHISQMLIDIISQTDGQYTLDSLKHYDNNTWAFIVYEALLCYHFNHQIPRDDLLNALTYAFNGRLAAIMHSIEQLAGSEAEMAPAVAQYIRSKQRETFLTQFPSLKANWLSKSKEAKPALTPTHFLEFIPGLPIVLPKKITGRGGKTVWTEGVFNQLHHRYRSAFNHFMHHGLAVPIDAPPQVYVEHLQGLFQQVEQALQNWLPGDPYTEAGIEAMTRSVFDLGLCTPTYSIRDEILEEMLLRFPPLNVIIPLGFHSARDLVKHMDVRDAATLAHLAENRRYADRTLHWILEQITPEDIVEVELKPLLMSGKGVESMISQTAPSNLDRITNRITIIPLNKGMGGDYPRLRFFLYLVRHIMIACNYTRLWREYARERRNLGTKILNSLTGRYDTDIFSAHNIFENMHHRAMVAAFKNKAEQMQAIGQIKDSTLLSLLAEGYGLSQVLEDGTFLPCSAWTWASYSYRGGKGIPTPLSSHVEEKWFNHDFLEAIQQDMGYELEQIEQMVTQLIGAGQANVNMLDRLTGAKATDIIVVPQEAAPYPPAGQLTRYENNPILAPIPEHYWESKYVLNCAALRIADKVYLFYRAFGDDEVSRIGLAVTDGYNVLERLPEPIFVPAEEREKKGCEDPRVVIIDDSIYMLYTAYDGEIAQVAAASIRVVDFLERRFDRWQRIGMAFEDIWDKDAILFPERINNKYVIYHRIEPSIWVSYLDELVFPAPKESHSIIIGPRSGRMWDSLKIGAGTQPIKTVYGWLMIYHGVDFNRVYRLGVLLVDHNQPERVIYRSPNPVLSPECEYEVGDEMCWVPNVVFTCGAVAGEDKEILEADDELLVYYGAADTFIGMARAKIGDLIPESIRTSLEADLKKRN